MESAYSFSSCDGVSDIHIRDDNDGGDMNNTRPFGVGVPTHPMLLQSPGMSGASKPRTLERIREGSHEPIDPFSDAIDSLSLSQAAGGDHRHSTVGELTESGGPLLYHSQSHDSAS